MTLRTISLRPNPKPKKKRKVKRVRKHKAARPRARKGRADPSGKNSVIFYLGLAQGVCYWRHGKWVKDRAEAERFSESGAIEQKERIAHGRKYPAGAKAVGVIQA